MLVLAVLALMLVLVQLVLVLLVLVQLVLLVLAAVQVWAVSAQQPARQAVKATPAPPTTQRVALTSMLRRHRLVWTTRWLSASMAGCLDSRHPYRPRLGAVWWVNQALAQEQTQPRH